MLPVSVVSLLAALPLCLDAFPLQQRGTSTDHLSEGNGTNPSEGNGTSPSEGNGANPTEGTCTNPSKRRAWHTLEDDQKRAYLEAQKCIMDMPGTLGLPGAKSKFDEMVSNHQILGRSIHATGAFFPYHRYLLHAHELLLQECGYSEGLPYWDEHRDAGNFAASDVFDADTGFGSAATGFDSVRDGPFADAATPIGPGWEITDNYLNRNINDTVSQWAVRENVDDCMVHDTYKDLWQCLYMFPHRGGHGGVGGTMRDPLTSPGDPVFYLHHSFVDKLWWDWQERDPENRMYDIGGPNAQTPGEGFPEIPGNMTEEDEKVFGKMNDEQKALEESGTRGDDGDQVTLSHVLTTLGVIPEIVVEDIMNTRGGYLCYEYV